MSTVPPSSRRNKLGDEPAHLCRLEDVTEARLRHVHEEKKKATKALKQEKEESIEQCQVAQQEKDDLQENFVRG
jgi:hypothetical protein